MRSHRRALGLAAGGLALYSALLRNRVLTWGATTAEAEARLPGDELLEDADGTATRAIAISADRVLPEFQHPQVGDTMAFGSNRMRLERVEADSVLAWRSEDGNWVWTFVLRPSAEGTRLISRNRYRLPRLVDRVGMLPMEPAPLLMERKMLLGIKQRAESLRTVTSRTATPNT